MNSDFCVAVHAVVFLSHKGTSLSSDELAANICTHPTRVRRVLSRLCKSNLLISEEGSHCGGYRFILDPTVVNLKDIASAMDVTFVETGWKSGKKDMDCLIASGIALQMDNIFAKMNRECYSCLNKISIKDLENALTIKNQEV